MKNQKSSLLSLIVVVTLICSCNKNGSDPASTIIKGFDVILKETFPNWYVFDFSSGKILTNPGIHFSTMSQEGDSLFEPNDGDLWTDDYSIIVQQKEPSIVDMGIKSLDEVLEAPATGYQTYADVGRNVDNTNHVYVIKTVDGKYAKIKIKQLIQSDTDSPIKFDWAYQPDGSRNLK